MKDIYIKVLVLPEICTNVTEFWKPVDIWKAKSKNKFYAFLKVGLFKAWHVDFFLRYRFYIYEFTYKDTNLYIFYIEIEI